MECTEQKYTISQLEERLKEVEQMHVSARKELDAKVISWQFT